MREFILILFFLGILIWVSVKDIREYTIPDGAILLAVIVRVVFFLRTEGLEWSGLLSLFLDGLIVSLPLLAVVLFMEKIRKRELMGGGDIKLVFVTGMYLGWFHNLLALLLACIIGIVIGIVQKKDLYFPFGPLIAVSAAIFMFIG